MKTSRQQILDYIRTLPTVTAGDLSFALGMTPANASHHLSNLLEEGVLQLQE